MKSRWWTLLYMNSSFLCCERPQGRGDMDSGWTMLEGQVFDCLVASDIKQNICPLFQPNLRPVRLGCNPCAQTIGPGGSSHSAIWHSWLLIPQLKIRNEVCLSLYSMCRPKCRLVCLEELYQQRWICKADISQDVGCRRIILCVRCILQAVRLRPSFG